MKHSPTASLAMVFHKRLDGATQAWYVCALMPLKPPNSVSATDHGMRGLVESESARWVERMVTLLEGEGRPIEGGWPGTVSEARSRLLTCLAEQAQQPPPDTNDLAILVDMLYSKAKQLWLQQR